MKGMRRAILLLCVGFFLMAGSAEASKIWFVTYGGGTNSNLWTYNHDANPSLDDFTHIGALQGDYWTDIAFGPDGTLYGLKWVGTGGNASLYSIPLHDLGNPTLLVGNTGKNLNSLGWVNGGLLAGSTDSKLVKFSYSSVWSVQDITTMTSSAGDIEKAADGTIYAAGWDKHFYEINPSTYAFTKKSTTQFADYIYGLAFDRDTGVYYGFSNKGQLGQSEGDSSLYSIGVGATDVTYTQVVKLDSILAENMDDVWGATTSPVPIPGAVWLLGSGLIGLAGLRRRFR